jgi:hypothetical protein
MGINILEAEISITKFANPDHSTNIMFNKIFREKVFPINGYAVSMWMTMSSCLKPAGFCLRANLSESKT